MALQKRENALGLTPSYFTALFHFLLSIKAAVVPSAQTLKITDFGFSDFELSDVETALCTIRMFTDLNLVQNFQMKHEVGRQRCALVKMCVCVCVCVCAHVSVCKIENCT